MPQDEAPKKRDPQNRRDVMASVGEFLRSSELFNWIILGTLHKSQTIEGLAVALGLLLASVWRFRLDFRKWGIDLLIACVFMFPFGVLTDPGLLTRNG